MTTATETNLLTTAPCVMCVKHPGVSCEACQGSLMMNVAVPMPTTEAGKGWFTNTPWTSPSDIAFYETLSDETKTAMRDEFGTMLLSVHDQQALVGGDNGWSEGYCTQCYDYTETANVIHSLRWEYGSDIPSWSESEEICTDCGESISFRDESEADYAAWCDAAERQFETMRDGGW
jgi:hypothetical protein